MKKLCSALLIGALCLSSLFVGCSKDSKNTTDDTTSNTTVASTSAEIEAKKEALRNEFLAEANKVTVNDTSVTFYDASGTENTITINKNPQKVVNLYASFTTLWYEAGGVASGCIGGSSSSELYKEYIGRDITTDTGMNVVATSSAGKKWDVETIIAMQPDLIICSTAMSGYKTISGPAAAANIPLIACNYDNFADYLKWFKVFCNLTGHPELWESVALPALDDVVTSLVECPTANNPRVFSIFASVSNSSLTANTSNTVIGAMITAMNATNIVDEWDNSTGAERLDINLETVFAANPDIILIQCHADPDEVQTLVNATYGDNPVWQSLDAVKNGKVYFLEKTLYHNKPNSRFAEAYQKLAAILYPDTEFSFKTN
ncbi:MAG: ABC transporter substrate-binding protein [Lachnospiraceae bacterium]|nr:ABC transporter substrate-binding protein [Lachnospiraceae bacterium]